MMNRANTCIFLCRCGAGLLPDERSNELKSVVNEFEADIYELGDLCALALKENDYLSEITEDYDKTIIIACYPRAIDNLLTQNNVKINNYKVLNFRELSPEQIKSKLHQDHHLSFGEPNRYFMESTIDVPAWYPVIDKSRCSVCGECADFCLFGVYKYDKERLEVVDPLACKNKCPACGRNCLESAIIFPKVGEKTYLAGKDEEKADDEQSKITFEHLKKRMNGRKSIFRKEFIKQAESEREKALKEAEKNKKKD